MLIVCACGFGLYANAAYTYTENWSNCENLSRTTCPAQFVGSSGDGSGITGVVQSYSDGSSWAYERYCRHALNMRPGQTATLDFSISTWVGPTSFSIKFIAYADSYSTISGGAAQLPNYPAKDKWNNIYSPEACGRTYGSLSSVQYKVVCELSSETSSNRTYAYRIYEDYTLLATIRGTRSKSWSDDSISGLFIITSPSTGNSASHNYSVSYNIGGWLTWTDGIDPSTQTYTVTYKPGANGTGSQQTATKTYGTALTLKGAIFTRTGYTQTGWATSDGGSKAYNLSASYTANADVTLYPFWTENSEQTIPLATALDNTELSFTTGGASSWQGQTSRTHDGVDAARSGTLGNSQTNWLQTTVSGSGSISFWWYASSEANYDYLEFLVDGSVIWSLSGTNNTWTSKTHTISTSGSHTLQWRYRKDGSVDRGLDAGFVDQVSWTPQENYTVTYAPGSYGTGSQQTATKTQGVTLTLKGAIFTRMGYTQTGWSTEASGASKAYDLGGNYTANASVTLYPYWESVSAKDPIPELPGNASEVEVLAALAESADAALVANVTNAAGYAAYRQWALSVTNGTTTANTIVESSRTWLSFALGAGGLVENDITSNDVHIVSFGVDDSAAANATAPAFAFEVAIDGVEIGGGSVAEETLVANLKKVLSIEGSSTLLSEAFASDNIEMVFDVPRDGRARFTAFPPAGASNSFFMRVKLNTYTPEENTHSGHDKVQLWEGGPYWATTNIGANEPWESGYYFWWGDTVGYKRENDAWVASDGSNSNYSFASGNTPTYGKSIATLQSEGWIDANNVLTPEHDAAQVQWGGGWRMPTYQELSDLNSKCDWTWTTTYGVNGYVVRGKGNYASNSIFLPCAGYGYGTSLNYSGSYGYFWSSVPHSGYSDYYAYGLGFFSSYHGTSSGGCFHGRSVRPVQGFTE